MQCTVQKLNVNSLTHGLRLTLQYCASPSPSEVKRSSSMMSSHPLKTDDTIALVTEKVRKMDARFVSKMQRTVLCLVLYPRPIYFTSLITYCAKLCEMCC